MRWGFFYVCGTCHRRLISDQCEKTLQNWFTMGSQAHVHAMCAKARLVPVEPSCASSSII